MVLSTILGIYLVTQFATGLFADVLIEHIFLYLKFDWHLREASDVENPDITWSILAKIILLFLAHLQIADNKYCPNLCPLSQQEAYHSCRFGNNHLGEWVPISAGSDEVSECQLTFKIVI